MKSFCFSSRFFKKFVCAFALVVLMAGVSFAKDFTFTLVNKSGFAIEKIFLNPTGIQNWDRDSHEVPGNFPVAAGDRIDITVENIGYKNWDMSVALNNGKQWNFHNIDFSVVSFLTVNVDGRVFDASGKYHDFPKPRIRAAARKINSRNCYRPVKGRKVRFTSRIYRAAPRRARFVRYQPRPCYRVQRAPRIIRRPRRVR